MQFDDVTFSVQRLFVRFSRIYLFILHFTTRKNTSHDSSALKSLAVRHILDSINLSISWFIEAYIHNSLTSDGLHGVRAWRDLFFIVTLSFFYLCCHIASQSFFHLSQMFHDIFILCVDVDELNPYGGKWWLFNGGFLMRSIRWEQVVDLVCLRCIHPLFQRKLLLS